MSKAQLAEFEAYFKPLREHMIKAKKINFYLNFIRKHPEMADSTASIEAQKYEQTLHNCASNYTLSGM